MADARSHDISRCIRCFKYLGKSCGTAGRVKAVCCGVRINSSRRSWGGCGTSLVGFALALVLVSVFVIWVYWDTIFGTTGGGHNATMEYYDKVQNDSNVLKVINRTAGYYDTPKDQNSQGIKQIGNNPDVVQLGNRTAEFYGNAKQKIADTFDNIRKHKMVEQAINRTSEALNKIKGWTIWG